MEILSLELAPSFSNQVADWLWGEWGQMEIIEHIKNIRQTRAIRTPITFPIIFIALENNELIGTISLLEDDMDIRPNLNPWLGCLYVDRRHRGKGVGSTLFDYCEEYAKTAGIKTLYLFTSKIQHLAAMRNWSVIEKVFFEDEMVSIMKKELDKNEKTQ